MNTFDEQPLVVESDSPTRTLALGDVVGRFLSGGTVVALIGPLGAGKTQFVKGIAQGNALGGFNTVTSPTFTLLQEYPGRLTLYHLDTYRLPNARALAALGFDELIRPDSAVLVEWADRAAELIPGDALRVEFEVTGPEHRRLSFSGAGPAVQTLIRRLRSV